MRETWIPHLYLCLTFDVVYRDPHPLPNLLSKILGFGAELQLSEYDNLSTVNIRKLIVVSIHIILFVLDRKVTFERLCTLNNIHGTALVLRTECGLR